MRQRRTIILIIFGVIVLICIAWRMSVTQSREIRHRQQIRDKMQDIYEELGHMERQIWEIQQGQME